VLWISASRTEQCSTRFYNRANGIDGKDSGHDAIGVRLGIQGLQLLCAKKV
jgi:hypothetical protein